ncbi:hypothetical protein KC355_g15683, partial [Hortaea werneckii]
MAPRSEFSEEQQPLTTSRDPASPVDGGDDDYYEPKPHTSPSTASTTSLVLEHLSDKEAAERLHRGHLKQPQEELDVEDTLAWKYQTKPADK